MDRSDPHEMNRHWDGIKYHGVRKYIRWQISDFFWDTSKVAYAIGIWVGEKLEDLADWVGRTKDE